MPQACFRLLTYLVDSVCVSERLLAFGGCASFTTQACLQTFADLAEAVSKDPKLRRHVPDNGAVHPLSSNVLRGVKRIMRFRRGYEELVQGAQMPWDPESAVSSSSGW